MNKHLIKTFLILAILILGFSSAFAQVENYESYLEEMLQQRKAKSKKLSGWIEKRSSEYSAPTEMGGGNKGEDFVRIEIISIYDYKQGNEHTFYDGWYTIEGTAHGISCIVPVEECKTKEWRHECPKITAKCEGRWDEDGGLDIDFDFPDIVNVEYPFLHGLLSVDATSVKCEDSKVIKINWKKDASEGPGHESKINITGELYRIGTKKDTLGKTVKVNEPIKTDKYTQRDIVVPSVGEVFVNTNSECVFETEASIEQAMGELFNRVKQGVDYRARSPVAAWSVRGTQFITKVKKDGTTTLTVLDGVVEFLDINKKKTVIVKKNQKSVVELGELPSEPVSIDPTYIPRWWE
ncbi:FecR domain-containing protein [candidate division WOR-3 bacterium]|nr:FecR domain-containing protein [candidate division WOR-3 bacterium]